MVRSYNRRTNSDKVFGDITGHRDPKPGTHYHLSCYVGRTHTRAAEWEGWATFTTIFQRRPDGYRFAVARQMVLRSIGEGIASVVKHIPDDQWLCWDLLSDQLTGGHNLQHSDGLMRPPPPMWTGPTEEALVMRAMALYDR